MGRYLSKNLFDVVKGQNRDAVISLLNSSLIKESIQSGGIIAGGFPRAVMLGLDLDTYFSPDSVNNTRPGDIDIFFKDPDDVKKVILNHTMKHSIGGFAKVTGMHVFGVKNIVQVQLVDHPDLCKPTVDEILDGFDFENCKVAIVGDKIFYPEGWIDLEESNLIKITSNRSPFMGSRLARYLKGKGFIGITQDSREKLSEWLTRASIKQFPNYNEIHMETLKSAIIQLQDLKQIEAKDLIFFLNKWQILTYPNSEDAYGPTMPVSVDWAITKIEEERRARLGLV